MAHSEANVSRIQRAWDLWLDGAVRPNGAPGCYTVLSQVGNGFYNVRSFWAPAGPSCDCMDAICRGGQCKHMWAASLAEATSRIQAQTANGRTHEELLQTVGVAVATAERTGDTLLALKSSALMLAGLK